MNDVVTSPSSASTSMTFRAELKGEEKGPYGSMRGRRCLSERPGSRIVQSAAGCLDWTRRTSVTKNFPSVDDDLK